MPGIDGLRAHTYMVRHNPNCPIPFEIRLCGESAVVAAPCGDPTLDRWASGNIVGHGQTMDEAAEDALAQMEFHRWRPVFAEIWAGL